MALFVVLAWRGFLIAWRAPDIFARLFATGLTCMLTIQTLVNIAVVTNSLPYTGVTLPLVSFGGSSTVISLIAIGLLLNISRHPSVAADSEPEDEDEPPPAPEPPPRVRVPRTHQRQHVAVKVAGTRVRSLRRVP